MEKAWYQAWQDLPQEQIQQWILAIPNHIQEIRRLEGGNEYKEGVQGFRRSWAGHRVKGKLSALRFVDRRKPQASNSQDSSDDELLDAIDDVDDVDHEESEEE